MFKSLYGFLELFLPHETLSQEEQRPRVRRLWEKIRDQRQSSAARVHAQRRVQIRV